MDWDLIETLAAELGVELLHRRWSVTTAESCTGGLVAGAITAAAGSSAWINQAVVTYSNSAKIAELDVSAATLQEQGAVSDAAVRRMASGASLHARAQVAIAISGVAGPGGGSAQKPVGTVWFGWSCNGRVDSELHRFDGDRRAVREAAVIYALRGTIRRVKQYNP